MTNFNSSYAKHLITQYNFALFPVHGINEDGFCTCGNTNCTNAGKHPASPNGRTDATKDMKRLGELWDKRINLNGGIATGNESGIFVIDIDGDDGIASFNELTEQHGNFPHTLTSKTARGFHIIMRLPEGLKVKSRTGLAKGIDVRGEGGYIVAPNSTHKSGHVYSFIDDTAPIADAPQWVIDFVTHERQQELRGTPAPAYIRDRQDWGKADIQAMLDHINPDCSYDEWFAVGMAIKDYGLPFEVWNSWSAQGSKYQAAEMIAKWNSFNGAGISLGTLVHLAKGGGWRPQHTAATVPIISKSMMLGQIEAPEVKPLTAETESLIVKPTPKPNGMYFISAADIKPNLEAQDFVQGVLTESALSVVYGESNCGKTFFMTDLAFHVALGQQWRDKRVNSGGVVYVALEGAYGLINRVAAFKEHHGIIPDDFLVVPCGVNFLDPQGNITEFMDLLAQAKEQIGHIKLVVIDTLARAIAGGDENSGEDMGMLVHHADLIRMTTGAHVCFIHHSGKDKLKGARGHSSLRAAVDTEIEISREPDAQFSTIAIVKQRDMNKIDDMQFRLESITLGQNQYGEDVTSCVVLAHTPEPEVRKPKSLTAIQQFVYDAITYAISTQNKSVPTQFDGNQLVCSYQDLRDTLEDRGFKEMVADNGKDSTKTATQSARVALKRAGFINFDKHNIWLK